MSDIVDQVGKIVGSRAITRGDQLADRAVSYWDSSPTRALCLVRPESTEQLSAIMRTCHEHDQSVVVQGGLTGTVEGAKSTSDDVIISLERMNIVESIDEMDGVAVIQAGAILQSVQEQLADKGFLFPLDFGARGSATIGGATATNAGGLNVLRYGMMRNLVLGLEAVLSDGTVISSMNTMLKNNTGYDLKQLFIGSEGTLGIVTRVVVKLYPLTSSRQTVMMAMNSFDAVARVLHSMRTELAGTLSAYEVMWNNYYHELTAQGRHKPPLDRSYSYYVLAEAEGSDTEADAERFEQVLEKALECGDVVDAVLPKSEAERDSFWAIREQFEAVQPAYLYDVSMPIRAMSTYVEKLEAGLRAWRPDASCNVFGHIADGNLHIFVKPYDAGIHHDASDRIVYGCLDGLAGSVSAEHGIGIEKKQWLGQTRSAAEIDMMRGLKKMLDPKNLLNPGKVV
ncbi:MAG: FAD-binding oxidoreductase [Woeseiaceae bacterium]|jgi:FAD/FMN-containing dehydrogenase